jgi:hypothetical protein
MCSNTALFNLLVATIQTQHYRQTFPGRWKRLRDDPARYDRKSVVSMVCPSCGQGLGQAPQALLHLAPKPVHRRRP